MRTTVADVVREVRNLLADPDRWTQGDFAQNAMGDAVPAWANEAVCWCLVGAIEKVCDESEDVTEYEIETALRDFSGWDPISSFNDNNPHAQVVTMLDRFLENEEADA